MADKLHYGFLDESGILENKAGLGRYFIVSVIVVAQPQELKHIFSGAKLTRLSINSWRARYSFL